MITLEEALVRYAQSIPRLPAETVGVEDSLGRVLAGPAIAETDLPRFDQSAMDGYALRSADVAGATQASPTQLLVTAEIAARAQVAIPLLTAGTAARIFTGAPLPAGADAVVAQERVTRQVTRVEIQNPVTVGRNIRFRGEEILRGTTVASAGQRVSPGLLAALVNAGLTAVDIRRRPRIRVLTSGDEVKPLGMPLRPGEIADSNGPMVRAELRRRGYAAPACEHVPDEESQIGEALGRALAEADLVITTGGASVGDRDYLPRCAEALGVKLVFWKVAQKPGKPMFFGMRGGTAVLGMPGNPGAVLVGLALHARQVLDLFEGVDNPGPVWFHGRLAAPLESDGDRTRLVRMRMDSAPDGTVLLQALAGQDSHMLGNLAAANVLAWIPHGGARLPAGTVVRWTALLD